MRKGTSDPRPANLLLGVGRPATVAQLANDIHSAPENKHAISRGCNRLLTGSHKDALAIACVRGECISFPALALAPSAERPRDSIAEQDSYYEPAHDFMFVDGDVGRVG